MYITDDVYYIGVNDHQVDLFEGQYPVKNGMAYNSYIIKDEKIAVMDTVDQHFGGEWLMNIIRILGAVHPDYLIVQHMEPDHSANIADFMNIYTKTKIVSSEKAFTMMKQFFGTDFSDRQIVVKEGDTLSLGSHTLAFVEAPMVHWPEVIVTYDVKDKILFSADGFGKFGALDVEEPWADEARRYYIGIVGQYGAQVQKLLAKAAALKLDIRAICPTHGPVLKENLGYYLDLYDKWSSYTPEEEGIVIAYTSVYGHTKEAVELLKEKLIACKAPKVVVYDLARDDMASAVSDAFRYSRLILATTTYNSNMYPYMHDYIHRLVEHKYQKRKVGLMENGSWAPRAASLMRDMLAGCDHIDLAQNTVTITSALDDKSRAAIDALAEEMCRDYMACDNETADKQNLSALFKIGYGLYVVTAEDGGRRSGCIVNAVSQITNSPNRIAVTMNKKNYTHDLVQASGQLNVNCLSVEAPFSLFRNFGFRSGKDADKYENVDYLLSDNQLPFLTKYINAFLSLKVEQQLDMGTHTMFVCSVTEARVLSDKETMTYNYYQAHVKPKAEKPRTSGYVCKVCGYIYEGDSIPADFVCPVCKHPVSDFEKI